MPDGFDLIKKLRKSENLCKEKKDTKEKNLKESEFIENNDSDRKNTRKEKIKIMFPKFSLPNIKLNNQITFIIIALIIASSYIHAENNKIKYQEKIKKEKNAQELVKIEILDICLDNARDNYILNWDNQCKSLKKSKDCSLPSYKAKQIEKWREQDENNCFKKYK